MFNRAIASAVAVILGLSGCANTGSNLVDLVTPTPVSVVLTVGRWILSNQGEVYEVVVEGQGSTQDQARETGWRRAVQEAVGSLNLTQIQRDGDQITQNRQIIYSSGFVHKWQDTVIQPTGQGWIVRQKVWVKKSSIADGLVGSGNVDYKQKIPHSLYARTTSRNQERQSGQELLEAVLEKWPLDGMVLKLKEPIKYHYDSNRQVSLVITNFSLGMTDTFRKSLEEVLERIQTKARDRYAKIVTGIWGDYDLADKAQVDAIQRAFGRDIAMRVQIRQGLLVVNEACWRFWGKDRFIASRMDSLGRIHLPTRTQNFISVSGGMHPLWPYQWYLNPQDLAPGHTVHVELITPDQSKVCR